MGDWRGPMFAYVKYDTRYVLLISLPQLSHQGLAASGILIFTYKTVFLTSQASVEIVCFQTSVIEEKFHLGSYDLLGTGSQKNTFLKTSLILISLHFAKTW
jgi:hypothetical protein